MKQKWNRKTKNIWSRLLVIVLCCAFLCGMASSGGSVAAAEETVTTETVAESSGEEEAADEEVAAQSEEKPEEEPTTSTEFSEENTTAGEESVSEGTTASNENEYVVVSEDPDEEASEAAEASAGAEETAEKTTYTVYVYVAAKDLEGNIMSDECLELLGIDKSTLDGNNYFPAGQIEISKSMIDGQSGSKTAGQPLINSQSDWETVLAALGDLDTSTLIDEGGVSYALNKGNKVGDYIGQAAADIGYTWGTQRTALFRWNGSDDYGFVDIDTYHLDLRFKGEEKNNRLSLPIKP